MARRYGGYWEYYPTSRPRRVEGGIKARSQRGKIGETWWADRWTQALESLGQASRLQRGRSYARQGQVLEYQVSPGLVTAKVQGSRPQPYDINIRVKTLSAAEWDRVAGTMAEQAIFAAQLLAGEMPRNIEEAFTAAGLSLFPQAAQDLDTSCSCPDWANPCKHIAAVYYLLGEGFDQDPFLIFHLRGQGREELTTALREKRSTGLAPEPGEVLQTEGPAEAEAPPLEECLGSFWEAGAELAEVRVAVAPPAVPEALLKRLGPFPLPGADQEMTSLLGEWYRVASQRALELAFGEDGSP